MPRSSSLCLKEAAANEKLERGVLGAEIALVEMEGGLLTAEGAFEQAFAGEDIVVDHLWSHRSENAFMKPS